MADQLVVKTSFIASFDGADRIFRAGDLIDANHPAVKQFPDYFKPQEAHRIEQATAAPGERRGRRRT